MYISRYLRPLSAALLCSLPAVPLAAQQRAGRPTAQEAQALLQSDPALVAKLRDRLAGSGMTPDQVRSRLRAEGYPEHMLDAYMTGGTGAATGEAPSDSVFSAVAALNLPADSTGAIERQWLQNRAAPDTALVAEAPTDTTGRTIYGLSMFRQKTSMFDPSAAGPVDESYVLGPGDQLVLILTGDVELAHSLEVTREGFVVIPQVGQLHVANLTLGQLDALLATRLSRAFGSVGKGPGAGTRYSVSVSRLHLNQVFVVGEATMPGSYQVSSAGTALSALYAAGGPSANGSMRRIEVRRGGRTVDAMDVYDYLLRGDASHDVRLKTGDIVFVPVHGPRVRVVGEVARPGTYEMKDQETLVDMLKSAGGFKAEAAQRRVMVERILPPGQRGPDGRDRVVIDVPAERLASTDGSAFRAEAGDVVRVFPVSDAVRDRIAVTGSVWAPGPQGFKPGMRLSDALRNAGGVRPDAMMDNVLVTRLMPDSTRRQLRATLTDRAGGVLNDLPLEENDEVQVFAGAQMREERYVSIGGAVRQAGRFPYRMGMTLRDLVLLAGGASESALGQAEIARLPEPGSDRSVTARTFRVPVTTKDAPMSGMPRPGGAQGEMVPVPTADAEIVLQPHDNVLILRRPDWTMPRTVMLYGEVQFPGRYTLTSRDERVSDVIKRAGGLTPEAFAQGLVFYRAENRIGRVGIDLPKVLKDPAHRDNMLLTNGDSLFVPRYVSMVDVRGAVNSPIAVAYEPGKKVDYYIRAAGGGTAKADLDRAYVTQASGKVESVTPHRFAPDGKPTPGAGSVVYVPQEDPSDKGPGYASIAGATAQMLGALVAILAIAKR
ncbi:MAG TPA: SLBB domain-containing protein [Gemmatimonadaceae bacterium]|nr:SLBB domain-containing protein [Gemmatimonadaceae bacterium]